jgi:hypothetical protein
MAGGFGLIGSAAGVVVGGGTGGPPKGEVNGEDATGSGEADGNDGNMLLTDGNAMVSEPTVANVNAPIVTIIIPYIITG